MFKIFSSLATFLLLLQTTATGSETLKLAATPWPPFTAEKGQPRLVIELVEEALRRAKISSTITIVKDGALTPALRSGQFDGSPALWRDVDRESYLEYSAPLLENRLMLVGKKGSNVRIGNLGELKGKRIGTIAGYSYGEAIAGAKETKFIQASNQQENLEKLLRGDLDYFLVEDLLMQHLLASQGEEIKSHLEIGTVPLARRTLYFAVRKQTPNAAGLIKDFNAKLNAMLADGTVNRILQLNWIEADVDGDGKMELVSRTNKIGSVPPSDKYSLTYVDKDVVSGGTEQFWVDGHSYSNWDHVPAQYKVDELSRREKSEPLWKFKF